LGQSVKLGPVQRISLEAGAQVSLRDATALWIEGETYWIQEWSTNTEVDVRRVLPNDLDESSVFSQR
jgi:hypothetical protein